jgi:hypothetical protein
LDVRSRSQLAARAVELGLAPNPSRSVSTYGNAMPPVRATPTRAGLSQTPGRAPA